ARRPRRPDAADVRRPGLAQRHGRRQRAAGVAGDGRGRCSPPRRQALMPESFDVIVIGGGPGGYVAAIRAAQLGQRTAVVERDKAGGRCLNYACIPAKTILRTAEIYDEARNGAELGIVGDVAIDWDALQARRAKVSESLSKGVEFLWDKGKVTRIEGEGSLTAEGDVSVGGEVHEAEAVIL